MNDIDDWEQLEQWLCKMSEATDKGMAMTAHQQAELEEVVLKMEALAATDEPKVTLRQRHADSLRAGRPPKSAFRTHKGPSTELYSKII